MSYLKLLALDTSSEACSAALLINNQLEEHFELAPKKHGELILPMIDRLLAQAQLRPQQLDAIAFACGPGAFTGVRIATSVAQGIAFGADLPVVPVSTLAALAQGGYRRSGHAKQLPIIDARMGEVYWGAYQLDGDRMVALADDALCAPEALPSVDGDGWYGLGSGWREFAAPLQQRYATNVIDIAADALPAAQDVAVLAAQIYAAGGAVSAEQALPLYLRNDVAKKKAEG